MKTSIRNAVGTLLMLCGVVAGAEAAGDLFEVELILRGPYGNDPVMGSGGSLRMDLSRENGLWRPVKAGLWSHGSNAHEGQVLSNEVTGASMRFRIVMRINDDGWTKGGYGIYDLALTRGTGDVWAGRFEAEYNGRAVSNVVTGRVKPPRPIVYPGWKPVAPNEYPRILFRKHELEGLRAKAKTPFGQEAMRILREMPTNAVALGLLYQLTGDRTYAARVAPILEKGTRTFVDGGKRKEWIWQAPTTNGWDILKGENPPEVRLEDNAFVLAYGDANMRATFVSPGKVVLSRRTDPGFVAIGGGENEWFMRNQIKARGETGNEGVFFVVATFQRGAAPEVKVEGAGLDSVVTVGARKIRVAGDRILMGE